MLIALIQVLYEIQMIFLHSIKFYSKNTTISSILIRNYEYEGFSMNNRILLKSVLICIKMCIVNITDSFFNK